MANVLRPVPPFFGLGRWLGPFRTWGITLSAAISIGMMAATHPLELYGIVGSSLAVWLILRAVYRNVQRQPERAYLTRVVFGGVLLRLLFVVVHLIIGLWFYGGEIDFLYWQEMASKMLEELIQGQFNAGVYLYTKGLDHLFTAGLLALLAAVAGPTLLSMFATCAAIGTAGAFLFLRAYQRMCPASHGGRFLAASLFLLPGISFWSIFLGKDVLVFFLMGWAAYAVARLLQSFHRGHALGLTLSIALLINIRPHIGIGVCCAAAIGLAMQPFARSGPVAFLRPVRRAALFVLIGTALAFISTVAFSKLGVKAMTLEAIAERAYRQQLGFALRTGAHSALPLALEAGDPGSVARFIPLGVLTLLFRPFPWEAHNILAVAAAAENVLLMGLVVWRSRAFMTSLLAVRNQPFLLYALVAFITISIALSFNWQLGTMARHRTMVLPYLLLLLAGPQPR